MVIKIYIYIYILRRQRIWQIYWSRNYWWIHIFTEIRNYDWNIIESDFSEKHKFFQEQYEAIDEIIDEVAEGIKDFQLILIDRVGYGFYYEQRQKVNSELIRFIGLSYEKDVSFNHNLYLLISSSGAAIVLPSIALGAAWAHTLIVGVEHNTRGFLENLQKKSRPTILHTVTRRRLCCIILTQASFPIAKYQLI